MIEAAREKILIVGPAWIGDMVMAQTLFTRLKSNDPSCKITVLAPGWAKPVLERMPEVDNSIDLPLAHGELGLSKRKRIGRSLKNEGYTQAIVLPNSFKSALIPFHASIPRRIGWRGEWRTPLLTDCRRLAKENYPLMIQRFASLAEPVADLPPLNIQPPHFTVDENIRQACLDKFSLSLEQTVVAICPGAEFGAAKQWPTEHFIEYCNERLAQGQQVWLFGSSNDQQVAQEIESKIEPRFKASFRNLAGLTALAEAIDLLSFAQICISNDSGLMHVAAALNVPVVAIYGSTSPDFTPPLGGKAEILTTDIECRPCFQRKCPLGHLKCLKEIEPSQVLEASDKLLQQT
ncbi:MAG: lipopolysaccharide heptosyltransferase II [Pseudohongiellaceae bacterium]